MRVGHGGCSLVDAGAAGGPRRGPKALSTTEKVQWQAIAWFRVPRVPRDLSAVGIRCDARAGPVSQRGDRLRWQARQCPAHEGQPAPETAREAPAGPAGRSTTKDRSEEPRVGNE